MASSKLYVTHNMTNYAKSVIASVRKAQHPTMRNLDEVKKILVDDVEVPTDLYPTNISQYSYNYISKTFNNMYGETAVDLLINMRMKVDWQFEGVPVETLNYWMGLINSRVFSVKNRDFKVNLYMPGFGFIESIWNTGAPIQGSSILGSGHDGSEGSPGSGYYLDGELLPGSADGVTPYYDYQAGALKTGNWYGSGSQHLNVTSKTQGVTDFVSFEIHWIEKKGIRLNKITDINTGDIIDNKKTS